MVIIMGLRQKGHLRTHSTESAGFFPLTTLLVFQGQEQVTSVPLSSTMPCIWPECNRNWLRYLMYIDLDKWAFK